MESNWEIGDLVTTPYSYDAYLVEDIQDPCGIRDCTYGDFRDDISDTAFLLYHISTNDKSWFSFDPTDTVTKVKLINILYGIENG